MISLVAYIDFSIASLTGWNQKTSFTDQERPTRYFTDFFCGVQEISVVFTHEFECQEIWMPTQQFNHGFPLTNIFRATPFRVVNFYFFSCLVYLSFTQMSTMVVTFFKFTLSIKFWHCIWSLKWQILKNLCWHQILLIPHASCGWVRKIFQIISSFVSVSSDLLKCLLYCDEHLSRHIFC